MKINEYQKLAMSTLNKELDKKDILIYSAMGLCGESGEVIDIVKKWLAQGHELDKDHLAKELGNYIKMLEHSWNLGYVILLLFLLFESSPSPHIH